MAPHAKSCGGQSRVVHPQCGAAVLAEDDHVETSPQTLSREPPDCAAQRVFVLFRVPWGTAVIVRSASRNARRFSPPRAMRRAALGPRLDIGSPFGYESSSQPAGRSPSIRASAGRESATSSGFDILLHHGPEYPIILLSAAGRVLPIHLFFRPRTSSPVDPTGARSRAISSALERASPYFAEDSWN